MTASPFIETRSGRRFHPLEPVKDDIFPSDIAHALSNQCRFSGHTKAFYSVAEHSVRVSELLEAWGFGPDVLFWGLMHDASEAYLVDLPQPLKHHPSFEPYRVAEGKLMAVICERFGMSQAEPPAVRRADAVLLATEARDLMPFRPEHWAKLVEAPLPSIIVPWASSTAHRNFLKRFSEVAT